MHSPKQSNESFANPLPQLEIVPRAILQHSRERADELLGLCWHFIKV